MKFEDFKKEWEVWDKIDSPEKLELCKKQFKDMIQRQEDDNFLEPSVENIDSKSISDLFFGKVKSLFGNYNSELTKLTVLCIPSFEPEWFIIVDNKNDEYEIRYLTFEINLWSKFYSGEEITKYKPIISKISVNKNLGAYLIVLINNAIDCARSPKSPYMVADGIQYFFSKIEDGKTTMAEKHSPPTGSESYNLIEVIEDIRQSISTYDQDFLKQIELKLINKIK